jgi:hypothetical protein
MFRNLTYKQKNRALLIAIVLLALVSYRMGLRNTIRVYAGINLLKEQLTLADNAPQKVAGLQARLAGMDQVLGRSQSEWTPSEKADTSVQQTLLGVVTAYCQKNHVALREFPKTIRKIQGEYQVETNFFVVEGGFIKLLELLYLLEQKNRVGKVASVNFITKKDYKTKALNLNAIIYVQNVKKASI